MKRVVTRLVVLASLLVVVKSEVQMLNLNNVNHNGLKKVCIENTVSGITSVIQSDVTVENY